MWAGSEDFREQLVGGFTKSESRVLIALLQRVTMAMQNLESDKADA